MHESDRPRLIRINEVMRITGLAKSTIDALIAENRFPKRVKVAPRTTGWVESEVLEWVQSVIDRHRPPVEVLENACSPVGSFGSIAAPNRKHSLESVPVCARVRVRPRD